MPRHSGVQARKHPPPAPRLPPLPPSRFLLLRQHHLLRHHRHHPARQNLPRRNKPKRESGNRPLVTRRHCSITRTPRWRSTVPPGARVYSDDNMSSPAARIAAAAAVGLGPNANWAQINHAKTGQGHRAAAPVAKPAAPAPAPAPAQLAKAPTATTPGRPPTSPEATDFEGGGSGFDQKKKNRGFGYRASLLSNPDAIAERSATGSRGRESLLGASSAGSNTATGGRSLLGL